MVCIALLSDSARVKVALFAVSKTAFKDPIKIDF